MNITKTNIDALNAVITIELSKNDYSKDVEAILINYRKTANIAGFRKGEVPMSIIKKQYGKSIIQEQANKVIQEKLTRFISAEKLDMLGQPILRTEEDFDWNAETITFEYEIGLVPQFEVYLEIPNDVTMYKIIADEKMLNEQVQRIQKQFGKMIAKNEVEENDDIRGVFINEEKGINAPAQITLDIFKDKAAVKKFIGKKVGDVVTVGTKGLFDDDHKLMDYLQVGHDDVHDLDINVDFKIEEITTSEPAELNQELFDKLFGEGNVSSLEEVKAKIKEDAEKQFSQQADQQFLNDVSAFLLEANPFELPATFLKKWIQTIGEKPLTAEQAEVEYARSENGLRYQLIEGKIMADNNLQISFEDLKAYASEVIKKQMAQFGQMNPTAEDVEGIVARVLSNQEEVKRLSEQVMSEKMLGLFKDKIKAKTKEVTYQDFVKEMYGE
ncbi:trigger factor [Flavobacterium sp.]|uniref:trigger factor n=1 Tax=Flavobacterium sp. TaxID=239 RepID=UPI003D6B6075